MFITASHAGQAHYVTGLLLVAAAMCAIPGARAASREPIVEETSLYLNVEKNNQLITGLGPRNFRLYIDGKFAPFRLEPPEEQTSIVVLAEFSRSSGYYFEDIDTAVRAFPRRAPTDGYWYALATYSQNLEVSVDFTQSPGEILAAWPRVPAPMWNEIHTYDAIYETLDKMGRLPGRRILIVIGSGIDTSSEHTMNDVKKKLEAVNVVVFVAGAGSAFRGAMESYLNSSARMTLLQARAFLKMLADSSGGFSWFPMMPNGFPDVIEGIMQSVASQYRLVCQLPLDVTGKFHKIKVEAFRIVDDKREDFKVLVRSGWR
ncbi:MAG TPA: hypothetical protein VHB50_11290 [Bryobacteraceae bacterium]|nr:hypothetical protein [Bryobacteraceae bacterium]